MKIKIKKLFVVSVLLMILFVLLPLGAQSPGLAVLIEPGENYSHRKWFGIFPKKLTPQIAVWVENEDGDIVQTLLVSKRGGEGRFIGTDEGRPEALPVFTHKNDMREIDDVTSATPKGKTGFSAISRELLQSGTYIIFAEVNSSFDYNEAYPEEKDDVNGQPSLIYRAEINMGQDSGDIMLIPFGTGSVRGETGDINPGVDGLSTALSILSSLTVRKDY